MIESEFENPFVNDSEEETVYPLPSIPKDFNPRILPGYKSMADVEEDAYFDSEENLEPQVSQLNESELNINESPPLDDDWDNLNFDELFPDENITAPPEANKGRALEGYLDEISNQEPTPPEDEWDFVTEQEPTQDEPESKVGNNQENESTNEDFFAAEDFPLIQEESLNDPSDEVAPTSNNENENETLPQNENKTTPGKKKFTGLLAQIKAEVKGGDAPSKETDIATEDKVGEDAEDEEAEGKKEESLLKKILGKILSPYMWFVKKLIKLLIVLFKLLSKLPIIGRFFKILTVPSKGLTIIAAILPLLLLILFLSWHSSRPLPPAPKATYPDNGSAIITNFGYDSKTHKAYATIKNTGDVVATVTPVLKVYSVRPGLNPLSFFYAKLNNTCKAPKAIMIEIEAKKKVSITCPIEGRAKKVTGVIKW